MNLTVKENGTRVANPALRGSHVNAIQIRSHYEKLLDELGFVFVERTKQIPSIVYVHKSTIPMNASSLCVVWLEDGPHYVLRIHRGDFSKDHNLVVPGQVDLHDFISMILESLRNVWVGGER